MREVMDWLFGFLLFMAILALGFALAFGLPYWARAAQDGEKKDAPGDPFAEDKRIWSQGDVVRLAYADALALKAAGIDTHGTRYLWSGNHLQGAARKRLWESSSFVINSLSRRRAIVPPAIIPGSGGSLLRIDLFQYGIDAAAWERLIELGSGPADSRLAEPYFHVSIAKVPATIIVQDHVDKASTFPHATTPKHFADNRFTVVDRGAFSPSRRTGSYKSVVEVLVDHDATVFLTGDRTDKWAPTGETLRLFELQACDFRSGGQFTYSIQARSQRGTVSGSVVMRAGGVTVVDLRVPKTPTATAQGTVQTVAAKGNEFLAHAPWLPQKEIVELALATKSNGPIVRSDWWIYFSTIPPSYYDMLGLGNKKQDFLNAAGVDIARTDRFETRGAVAHSTVALHNRALKRFPTFNGTFGGNYWESLDFKKSFDAGDVLANLLVDKSDARELIASLPNGLQFYFLVNANDERQDVVPADIAIDNETSLQDKQIFSGRNCMTCHGSGMRPIADRVRDLSRDKIALLVPGTQYKSAQDVLDRYFSVEIDQAIKYDSTLFQNAVKACNSLAGEVNANQLLTLLRDYIDAPVTLEMLAAEAGVTPATLSAVLGTAVNLDHSLSALLASPPRVVRRDWIERRGFGQALLLLHQAGALR